MRALPLLLLFVLPAFAAEHVAELKGEPVPEPAFLVFELKPAPPEILAAVAALPAAEDRLFAGSFRLTPDHPELRVVLVEPPQGEPWLYADEDLDGRLSSGERFLPGAEGEVLLKLPPLQPGRPRHPVRLLSSPVRPGEEGIRRMLRSRGANVEGTVQIGAMEMLVRYPVDPRTGQADPKGRIGMDMDEDGVIEMTRSAGEVKMDVGDGPPIFRHRDTYLSIASFDLATGRLVVKTHPASDYKEFDLRPGAELPDFAFTDLEGRQRRFAELRGKVVLLDFWAISCGPCVAEMPALRKVQQDLGERGFVILGMDVEDDLEAQKKFVAEQDLPWLHATSASVQDTILKRFGVTTFPTHILVDREGRIVSAGDPGQPPLKKDKLAATVEEVVSRKPPVEYVGRLDGEPMPRGGAGSGVKLDPASPELLADLSAILPAPPSAGEKVYAGKMQVLRGAELEARVVLVERPEGRPFLYVDADLDGKLAAGERFELGDWPELEEGWGAALVRFPMTTGSLRRYPVLLSWNPESRPKAAEDPWFLMRSLFAFVEGTVPVEGREVKVRYPLSRQTSDVEFLVGELAMDLDGDGAFSRALPAGETRMAMGDPQPIVFRLGDLYLSTRSVDAAAGRVVLRTHAPSEYRRFDLSPGSEVPDFAYTDLQGQTRRLSELRGKVVLLDFWGVWCPSCVEELPRLQKAYETYRGRGLEILGMDRADKLETQKKFVEEKGLPWPQATAASVEDVIRRSFEVWRYPTKILLDREGRVLAVVDEDQTEEDLVKMLESALPGTTEETAAGAVP